MKRWHYIAFIVVIATMNGCAGFGQPAVAPGETEQAVLAKLGQPTHRYQDGNTQLLEYAQGFWGQQTYMARIGPDKTLISYEPVLTAQKFALIKLDTTTKEEVLRMIGAPAETSFLSLSQLEVWSYPYKESGVWDSMMHVHFDNAGIVRKMFNGPDPTRDPDERWPFGMFRAP